MLARRTGHAEFPLPCADFIIPRTHGDAAELTLREPPCRDHGVEVQRANVHGPLFVLLLSLRRPQRPTKAGNKCEQPKAEIDPENRDFAGRVVL